MVNEFEQQFEWHHAAHEITDLCTINKLYRENVSDGALLPLQEFQQRKKKKKKRTQRVKSMRRHKPERVFPRAKGLFH